MTREEAIDKMCLDKIFGYKSPIETIVSDMQMTYENEVYEAVQNVGIIVDKEELIKALQYDRNQYEKGYADAKAKFEIPHGEWISRRDRFGIHLYSVCSECNVAHNYTDFPNFCPNCGSDNRREGEQK